MSWVVCHAAMNTGVQIYFDSYFCVSFEYNPRRGIADSYGNFISNFLRKPHTVSIMTAPIYNPTNSSQGSLSATSSPASSSFVFFMIAIPTGVRCWLTLAWIYIFLMISDSIFPCTVGHLCVFRRMSDQNLEPSLFIMSSNYRQQFCVVRNGVKYPLPPSPAYFAP